MYDQLLNIFPDLQIQNVILDEKSTLKKLNSSYFYHELFDFLNKIQKRIVFYKGFLSAENLKKIKKILIDLGLQDNPRSIFKLLGLVITVNLGGFNHFYSSGNFKLWPSTEPGMFMYAEADPPNTLVSTKRNLVVVKANKSQTNPSKSNGKKGLFFTTKRKYFFSSS